MEQTTELEFVSQEDLNEMLLFLDGLRESAVTNMFGAAPYLREQWPLSRRESQIVLSYWMKTFSERNPQ